MKDTSPEAERKFREMLLRRTGEERLKMGCSMHATAQALVRASVLEKDPLASPAALRQALFLRFYGRDFAPAVRERILLAMIGSGVLYNYFRYWGKADPSYEGDPKWHPLPYHCLDVAAEGSQRRVKYADDG